MGNAGGRDQTGRELKIRSAIRMQEEEWRESLCEHAYIEIDRYTTQTMNMQRIAEIDR
jgi:hypothetical protein